MQTAIDHVLLQSDVPVDLLDVEKNSAVVSYSACDPEVFLGDSIAPIIIEEVLQFGGRIVSEWKCPVGDVPMPGEHDAAGDQNQDDRGAVRNAAGVRHAAFAAQMLSGGLNYDVRQHVSLVPYPLFPTTQVQRYQIKPLSLHMRTHKFDETRPANTLRLKGQFSLAEMHTWVGFCLPEVPEKPPSGETAVFTFISTFLDTLLLVEYQ